MPNMRFSLNFFPPMVNLYNMSKIGEIISSLWNLIQDIISAPGLKPIPVPVRVKPKKNK